MAGEFGPDDRCRDSEDSTCSDHESIGDWGVAVEGDCADYGLEGCVSSSDLDDKA